MTSDSDRDLGGIDGVCERCRNPSTKGRPQQKTIVPVGSGWGMQWLCMDCIAKDKAAAKPRRSDSYFNASSGHANIPPNRGK
jgi:hypothetical protein